MFEIQLKISLLEKLTDDVVKLVLRLVSNIKFKFHNSFSSVNINNYDLYNLDFNKEFYIKKIKSLFNNYINKVISQIELETVQKDSIRVAPFSVLEKFKTL